MGGLKASWEVTAGIIPGTPMPELTKRWNYSGQDFDRDRAADAESLTLFRMLADEARHYAQSLQDPRRLNWVNLTWLWW